MHQSWIIPFLLSTIVTHAFATAEPQPAPPENSQHSDEAVAKRDYFYVGGQYVQLDTPNPNGTTIMTGQMYVERLLPLIGPTQKYPLVFWHGLGQTGSNWLNTPDGRQGWASYFLNQGYEVYLVDQPQRGRSLWETDQGSVTYFTVEELEDIFTAPQNFNLYPQAALHTQFPGTGMRGDPIFDSFYASQMQSQANVTMSEANNRNAGAALFDKIGEAILITHSQGGIYGWGIGDMRPDAVKGILSIEPEGPPFEDVIVLGSGAARAYGLTDLPLTYDPPVNTASDLVHQTFPPTAENLTECVRQADPPKKLPNLSKIPVMVVTSQASFHAGYDYCTVAYLQQAGVQVQYLNLTAAGIFGNAHFLFLEKNNLEIAPLVDDWFHSIK